MPHRRRPVPLRHAAAQAAAVDRARRTRGSRRASARPGFVFVGKTNTPELATSVTTEPLAYGATHNPWDLTRSPGGSSGGSAAAVASGMVAVAHGNDMGGSIRFPASMCGIVGLKPTAPHDARPRLRRVLGTAHARARAHALVRDTALVLDAVAGAGPGDPYTAPPPTRPFRDEVGAPLVGLRIGLRTRTRAGAESAPDCVRAVDNAGRLLESLGHHVEIVDLPALDQPIDGAFGIVMTVAVARDLARWSERTGETIGPDDVEPGNLFLARDGRAGDRRRLRARDRGDAGVVAGRRRVVGRPRHPRHPDEPRTARAARRAGARTTPTRRSASGWERSCRSRARSTSPASPRSRSRCTGTTTACRSACNSPPRTDGKTCCSG